MYRINHFLGGVLLVAGTTVGAGMLAVPVTTAFMGFFPSLLLFLVCWFFMLLSAFSFIDVNLAYKEETNIISMAGKTLGLFGKGLGWVFYMLLLYALIAAYICGSAPLFEGGVTFLTGWHMPKGLSFFALPLIFGSFIYFGTLGVDIINRILMIGLFLSYFILIVFVPSHIEPSFLTHVDFKMAFVAIAVIVTSFGYHIIIPSLSTYMNHDKKKLKRCVFFGSLISLLIYVIWQILIMGTIPLQGENSLIMTWQLGANAAFPLAKILHTGWISLAALFFSFFAIVTSFLGVSLSLSDFLVDGLKIKKTWEGRLGACLLTFAPPLFFVFTYQRGFYLALEHAGAFVAVLLIFLPALMAYRVKKIKKNRLLLWSVMIFALLVVAIDCIEQAGFFDFLLARYTSHV